MRLGLALIFSLWCGCANASDAAIALLNHTAWTDIGVGRSLPQLTPTEIARLRRCDVTSMYFEHWEGRSFDEVFLTGISMRSTFARVEMVQSPNGKAITLFRSANAPKPDETLYLSNDGTMLTQVIPPASPHFYVRCQSSPAKAGK
jgi:hypothetical protein